MKTKLFCGLAWFLFLSASVRAATFVVTNTLPSGPGSFRDALYSCATNYPGTNRVMFAIPGTPPFVISPTNIFPNLYDDTTVDGTTQAGWSNNYPAVWIDGPAAGVGGVNGLTVSGSRCLIRGLRIQKFSGAGIRLDEYSGTGESNRVEGCHIFSNGYYGVQMGGASNGVLGGYAVSNRNVISGNQFYGVYVSFSSGNLIAGNWIGVTPTNSSVAMGGQGTGIYMKNSERTVISGSNSAQQVISGNGFNGIYGDGASFTTIIGNRIGCNESATVAVSNNSDGIAFWGGVSNRVGGGLPAQRNYISGNKWAGIEAGGNAEGLEVKGNYIGTTFAGNAALTNGYGVFLSSGVSNSVVGGSLVGGEANLISGNSLGGVYISGNNNRLIGNVAGLAADYSSTIGNGNDGVSVSGAFNSIGGTNAGEGNIISGNARYGVYVGGGQNVVQANVIGLDIFGNRRPNQAGVYIGATSGNLIGGTTTNARNIISGNVVAGVYVDIQASGDLIQGNYIGVGFDGLTRASNTVDGVRVIGGTNVTIGGSIPGAGNVIAANGFYNIDAYGSATGLVVQGNYIGLGADGKTNYWSTNALGRVGVAVKTPWTLVGGTDTNARNIIAGNGGTGILVSETTNVIIQGNYIGLGPNGTNVIPNGTPQSSYGIYIGGGASRVQVGGLTPGARNVIAGDYASVYSLGPSHSNVVWGNYLGLTAGGNVAVTNTQFGVLLYEMTASFVGGTNAGAGNVVYGSQVGVDLVSTNTHHNYVQGNYVGLNASGGFLATSVYAGVSITRAQSNTIGGASAAARNVIMCGPGSLGSSGTGIEIFQSNSVGNVIQGNYINVGPDGISPRKFTPNIGVGIEVFFASGNTIGGTNAGEGNIVAHCSYGIFVSQNESKRNALFGNTVYSNVWNGAPNIGIDLGPTGGADGTTPNDNVPDSDTGPNDLQNFPVITNAVSMPGSTRIQGRLASATNAKFRIEFFYSDTTNAEGRVYLGATNISTAANGTGTFTAILTGYAPTTKYITATATDTNNNTSEFCPGAIKPTPAIDTDGDGMPDYWEALYGLNANLAADATNHLDSDGINNLNEYLSGTIPNNSNSFLRITALSVGDINWVTFPSSQYRNYNLEAASTASNNAVWTPIITNYLGSGLTLTLGDAVDSTSEFYRVRSIFP